MRRGKERKQDWESKLNTKIKGKERKCGYGDGE